MIKYNFKTIKEAGLTQTEAANLFGTSRITVNGWVRGRVGPHHLLESRVDKLLRAMCQALLDKDLPIPSDTPREQRIPLIRKVMARAVLKIQNR